MAVNGTVLSYRSGTSFARGTTIDEYLDAEACALLYDKWQKGWPEPYMFSGGVTAITCEQVLEVSEKEFIKVYGKRVGTRIIDTAKRNGGR